jgi:hypothetical protein
MISKEKQRMINRERKKNGLDAGVAIVLERERGRGERERRGRKGKDKNNIKK